MREQCEKKQGDDVRWLALLARRIGLMLVTEVERRYDMPSSVLTKQERDQRKVQKAA